MRNRIFISVISLAMIAGCASVNVSEHMFSEVPTQDEQQLVMMRDSKRKPLMRAFGLEAALEEFETYRKSGGEIRRLTRERKYPTTVLGSDATYKLLKAMKLRIEDPGKSLSVAWTKADMKRLHTDIISTMELLQSSDRKLALEANLSFTKRLSSYLEAYYNGKFVDRQGNKIGKPKLSNNISTDTIAATVQVFWEAMMDEVFVAFIPNAAPPVMYVKQTILAHYVENPIEDPEHPGLYIMRYKLKEPEHVEKKFLTIDHNTPTVVTFDPSVAEEIETGNKESGITKRELELINKAAGLAGDRAKLGAGYVVRILGDIELSFVFGGHFSFGDNDTLAKVVETTLEVGARRFAEAMGYVAAREVGL
ncbi:MAG: hypothetical protein GTO13_23090 [Proteobacteria bacterium]|nr:hypothetical protein [Pseudomonadota bacterium]